MSGVSEVGMAHRDGVWWNDAPVPPRWHRCWAQTTGFFEGRRVERCACGAIRYSGDGVGWTDRNSRR